MQDDVTSGLLLLESDLQHLKQEISTRGQHGAEGANIGLALLPHHQTSVKQVGAPVPVLVIIGKQLRVREVVMMIELKIKASRPLPLRTKCFITTQLAKI